MNAKQALHQRHFGFDVAHVLAAARQQLARHGPKVSVMSTRISPLAGQPAPTSC